MPAYLDAGFLLTVIIPTRGSPIANDLLRELGAPFLLNFLHQIQLENLLATLQKSQEVQRQRMGNEAQRLWRHYFSEGVFQLFPTDWDSGFRIALTWNSHHPSTPPPFLLLIHAALASVAGASEFLSFDPRSREMARSAGMRILPEEL